MKNIKAEYKLTENETKKLLNEYASQKHYDTIVDEDANCYDYYGNPLFFLRKNYIKKEVLEQAYQNMKYAAKPTSNRGISSGASREALIRKDGKKSRTMVTVDKITGEQKLPLSGITGFFDPSGRDNYCRKTAFNMNQKEKFEKAMPLIEAVNYGFKEIVPDRYEKQYKMVLGTDPYYRIGNTAFSTITVNKDYRTTFHTDAGDYPQGFGNLVAYCRDIEPVYLVLPKFGIAINIDSNDLLLVDVHQVHGNTEIIKKTKNAVRLSFVMYYRKKMYKCLKPSEELKKAQIQERSIGQRYIDGIL
tara:strand:- start:454 stop:1362 length:909 start_codon:yes stop_codon:yes gene_type:complete